MTNLNTGSTPWDIDKLKNPSSIRREGVCATGSCGDTVAVDGVCYNSKQVNYALWGKINRLCSYNLSGTVGLAAAYKGAHLARTTYRTFFPSGESFEPFELRNAVEAIGWTVGGWSGMGQVGIAPPSTHKECTVSKNCKCKEPEAPWPYIWSDQVDFVSVVSTGTARQVAGTFLIGLDAAEPMRRTYDTATQAITDAAGVLRPAN